MKLIYEPTVRLMTKQVIEDLSFEKFLEDNGFKDGFTLGTNGAGDPDTIPEIAGRVCYMSFAKPRPGGNEAYIKHIKEVGHGSVLEHTAFGVLFEGVSRSLSHELVRHRAGFGFSQLSQRYVDESDVAFVVPPWLRGEVEAAEGLVKLYGQTATRTATVLLHSVLNDHETWAGLPGRDRVGLMWLAGREADLTEYKAEADYLTKKLVDAESRHVTGAMAQERKLELRKAARSTARNCLPNCAETKVFCTVNARAVRHFVEMRGARPAEDEIRKLAHALWQTLVREAPHLFCDYEWQFREDGFPIDVTTPYKKV